MLICRRTEEKIYIKSIQIYFMIVFDKIFDGSIYCLLTRILEMIIIII